MEDREIVRLYFARSEQALVETQAKYGAYCYSIAYNILTNSQDAEECVSDTYLAAWNRIPPKKPDYLGAFLGRITRYLSIDRWRSRRSQKRGGGEIALALEELGECASQKETLEEMLQRKQAAEALNRFLGTLPETERNVLLCRYWYMDSIGDIAEKTGFTTSKVASMLHRTRSRLRAFLEADILAMAESAAVGEPLEAAANQWNGPDYNISLEQNQDSYVEYEPWYPLSLPDGYTLDFVSDKAYGVQYYRYTHPDGGSMQYAMYFRMGQWGLEFSGDGDVRTVEIGENTGYYAAGENKGSSD